MTKKVKSEVTKTKHIKAVSEDFNVRKKKYEELKELRKMVKERKIVYSQEQRKIRERTAQNKARKAENELKHGGYEIIKNPEKIKKWKVKARKMIRNVPKEIFYSKYFNKEQ